MIVDVPSEGECQPVQGATATAKGKVQKLLVKQTLAHAQALRCLMAIVLDVIVLPAFLCPLRSRLQRGIQAAAMQLPAKKLGKIIALARLTCTAGA